MLVRWLPPPTHTQPIHTLHPECPVPSPTQTADSRLMARRPTGHVADAVLPPHGSTVRHLHLQTWWIMQRGWSRVRNGSVCGLALNPPPFPHMQGTHGFTFDFFGELDPVRVGERAGLLVYVVDVQHFTHELDDRLGLVEGSGRNCNKEQGRVKDK